MKVVAIMQARMRSTRLPGKIMKRLCGRSVLEHDIRRLKAAKRVDQVVVATTDLEVDNPVAEEAQRCGAAVFRGSEEDVLSRYQGAAAHFQADVIVRMTSDCPLFDPWLLDDMLDEFLASLESDEPYDYYSNTLSGRTYPTGLDAEIFTREALERAHREGRQPHEREHVTPYLHQNPQLFKLGGMRSAQDHSRHRWTLDTPEDLDLITRLYEAVHDEHKMFTTEDVLQALERHPEWERINRQVAAKPIDPVRLGSVVFRVDASEQIGAGHVMRCLALAQAWPQEAGTVIFAMAEGAETSGPRLRDEGFRVEKLRVEVGGREDVQQTAALAEREDARWVVLDGYRFGAEYFQEMGSGPCRLLLMDDEGQENLAGVDVVLNQNLHAGEDLYPGAPETTKRLLGPAHVLLRREFFTASSVDRDHPLRARNILVTLGGADPENHTAKVLAGIEEWAHSGLSVRVLVGANNPHRAQLADLVRAASVDMEILTDVSNMPAQYGWADLAVTAGGSTLWELAYHGVPALTLILADNQEPSSRLLHEAGVVECLGWAVERNAAEILSAVRKLAEDKERREAMSRRGRALIDGRGRERVLAALGQVPVQEAHA